MRCLELKASLRKKVGKGARSKLIRQGLVPAVLYNKKRNSLPIAIPYRDVVTLLSQGKENVLIALKGLGNKNKTALIKELQVHPVKGSIRHLDLYEVALEDKVEITLPVVPIKEAKGVKAGGILEEELREVRIKCQVSDIPEKLEVDVENLDVGEVLYVGDIKLPPGVEILTDKDVALFRIAAPPAREKEEEKPSEETKETEIKVSEGKEASS
jgi:large subunit ribosomal protein L25